MTALLCLLVTLRAMTYAWQLQVRNRNRPMSEDLPQYDAAIIGAGPLGVELAVHFKRAGVHYIHFDARQIANTITWWPRNTPFFSTTERLAIAGVPIQNLSLIHI